MWFCLQNLGKIEGEWRWHRKLGAEDRGSDSWQLLHYQRDVASWSRAVVLWDPELLLRDANAWI